MTTQTTHPQSTGDIIAQLMAEAKSHSDFSKRMQAERTAEYVSRGDLDSCYKGIEPSETIYWQAADRIADLTLTAARLSERVKALEAALKSARPYVEPYAKITKRVNGGPAIKVIAWATLDKIDACFADNYTSLEVPSVKPHAARARQTVDLPWREILSAPAETLVLVYGNGPTRFGYLDSLGNWRARFHGPLKSHPTYWMPIPDPPANRPIHTINTCELMKDGRFGND